MLEMFAGKQMYVGNLLPDDHGPPDRFAHQIFDKIINLNSHSCRHLWYCCLQGRLAGQTGEAALTVCQDVPGQTHHRKRDGPEEERGIQGSVERDTKRCRNCKK